MMIQMKGGGCNTLFTALTKNLHRGTQKEHKLSQSNLMCDTHFITLITI